MGKKEGGRGEARKEGRFKVANVNELAVICDS